MPALSSLEAIASIRQTLTGAGLSRQVEVGWVSPGFLPMLGVDPVLGRLPADSDPPGTAVVSHALWLNELSADPNVVGRVVRLDGYGYTVVGVLPGDFRLELPPRGGPLPDSDIWKTPDTNWQNGDVWGQTGPEFGLLRMVGLLADGATRVEAQAQAQADASVSARSAADAHYASVGYELTVHDLRARLVADARPTLLLLMGAVGFVLLIACANVMNLLLARAHARHRELALRLAIGASRGRVVRYLLVESLGLAIAGAAVGLGLAWLSIHMTPLLASADLPRLDRVSLDAAVTLFVLGVALGTTILVGTAPAMVATRTDPAAALARGREGAGRGARLRDGLVATQVALSLVLLGASVSWCRASSISAGSIRGSTRTASTRSPSRFPGPTTVGRRRPDGIAARCRSVSRPCRGSSPPGSYGPCPSAVRGRARSRSIGARWASSRTSWRRRNTSPPLGFPFAEAACSPKATPGTRS